MAVELVHYKLTADEYQRMIEVGIIAEGAPVELIEGELIQMAAFGGEHLLRIGDLTRLLILATEPPVFVSPQGSIRLNDHSEPEPDFAILRARPLGRTPPPADDVVLVIEVSDSSLMYDLNVKGPLYARARIPEYWVVDLTAQRVLRHCEPRDGRYTVVDEFSGHDQIRSLTEPPITIRIDELFAS
jgi:Uma2 family endonuclease